MEINTQKALISEVQPQDNSAVLNKKKIVYVILKS